MYLSVRITLLYKSLPFPRQSVCDEYSHLVLHVNALSFVKIMEMGQCSVDNYERLAITLCRKLTEYVHYMLVHMNIVKRFLRSVVCCIKLISKASLAASAVSILSICLK